MAADYNKLLQTKLKTVNNANNKLLEANQTTNLDELKSVARFMYMRFAVLLKALFECFFKYSLKLLSITIISH